VNPFTKTLTSRASTQMPIDIINGSDKLRKWIENNISIETLDSFENLKEYRLELNEIKIY
jgi:hypothetical protein